MSFITQTQKNTPEHIARGCATGHRLIYLLTKQGAKCADCKNKSVQAWLDGDITNPIECMKVKIPIGLLLSKKTTRASYVV